MPGNATMTGPGRVGGGSGGTGDVTGVAAGNGIVVTNPTGPVPTVAANNVSGDAGIVITQALGQDTFQQNIAAEWPVANMRVYAVDFVNGNDNNAGFADAAGTSAGQYATACQAAGAVAKKTFAGLAAIFPRIGNGRLVEIVIRNGGVNTEQAYTEALETFLGGVFGYGSLLVRGTGTNTTAGAVAFDGSTADIDYQGGITANGCNSAGYNPVAAFSTSVIKVLKVGGGAAAIPVEPAAPLGWRIRFDGGMTTQASLRNVCRQIAEVQGTDTLVTQTALPATPVGTDVCYLEQAGVTFGASTLAGLGASASTTNSKIVGLRCTGALNLKDCEWRFTFCGCNSLAVQAGGMNVVTVVQDFAHPILGTRTIGGGLRAEAASSLVACQMVSGRGLVVANTLTINNGIGRFTIGVGCYSTTVLINQLTDTVGTTANSLPVWGGTVALAATRISAGRLRLIGTQGTLGIGSIVGAGGLPAVQLEGRSNVAFNGVVSGATGNNDVGLDLTLSRNSLILLTTTPTVTGALGDIRLAGGQIVTWAQAIATGITDSAGNRIVGTAGVPPQAITKASGSVIGGAGAVVSYMADTGPLAANQIVPLRYPTSFRLATRLRVTNLVNTSANAVTVTLYKNAVATAMTVSIPAATAANTKFADTAHPILFLDGDDFDLRMDDAADVGGVVSVSAALEWAV